MKLLTPAFEARLEQAIAAIAAQDEFAASVLAGVEDFFKRHPSLERTRGAELIATVTIFEQLTACSEHADANPQSK